MSRSTDFSPGVVNDIGQTRCSADPTYDHQGTSRSTCDLFIREDMDWTIKRPETEKDIDPPREPIYWQLLGFLKLIWAASGAAINIEASATKQLPGISESERSRQ